MFNFFRKKTSPISQEEEKPKEQKKSEPETITLSQNDNCFIRAEKICLASGLIDQGFMSSRMAKYIQIYMDLDKRALESDAK